MKHIGIIILLLYSGNSLSQQISYTPDLLTGHRSFAYMHHVTWHINKKVRLNNLTLFDTEYCTDRNNIFFIRSLISYDISKRIALNAAVGMKNPGRFFMGSIQYKIIKPIYSFSYQAGATYQNGFTLEQSIALEHTANISANLQSYFHLAATANVNFQEFQRGLQYMRLGLKRKNLAYGFAVNVDQFYNNQKRLKNFGIFIKPTLKHN